MEIIIGLLITAWRIFGSKSAGLEILSLARQTINNDGAKPCCRKPEEDIQSQYAGDGAFLFEMQIYAKDSGCSKGR